MLASQNRLTAFATKAEHVEFVGGDGKTIAACNFFLEFFNQGMIKFDNFSTFGADHMIVMTMHELVFIPFLTITKI